jgi:hypothetical protein
MISEGGTDDVVGFRVVAEVADRLGAEPLAIAPLGSVVDPEFLEKFVANRAIDDDSELRFDYAGCEVVVRGDGDVTVADAD